MPDRASRFITFRDTNREIANVRVLLGDGAPQVVSGYAGWSTVARPRRTALTIWEGYEPMRIAIPIIFNAFGPNHLVPSADRTDRGVEAKLRNFGLMMGRGEDLPGVKIKGGKKLVHTVKKKETLAKIARKYHVDPTDLLRLNRSRIKDPRKLKPKMRLDIPTKTETPDFGEPPVITVDSTDSGWIIPYNETSLSRGGKEQFPKWVIDSIEWGDTVVNDYGFRIRQFATVTIMQYVPPIALAADAAPWRRNKVKKKNKKTTIVGTVIRTTATLGVKVKGT